MIKTAFAKVLDPSWKIILFSTKEYSIRDFFNV